MITSSKNIAKCARHLIRSRSFASTASMPGKWHAHYSNFFPLVRQPILCLSSYESESPFVRKGQLRTFFSIPNFFTNPVVEFVRIGETHVIDFAKITPKHVISAASKKRSEYKQLLSTNNRKNASLWNEFQNLSSMLEYLVYEVKTLQQSLDTLLKITEIMIKYPNVSDKSWLKARFSVACEKHVTFSNTKLDIAKVVVELLLKTQTTTPITSTHLVELSEYLGDDVPTKLILFKELLEKKRSTQDGALDDQFVKNMIASQEEIVAASERDANKYLMNTTADGKGVDMRDVIRVIERRLKITNSSFTKEQESVDKLTLYVDFLIGKQALAKLLGFKNHVDRVFEGRMFSKDQVEALLTEVADRARAASFTLSKESKSKNEDEVTLSDYVTLDGTLRGLFALCRSLFGITITEDRNPRGWHKDVRLYHVTNENNGKLGSFYFDPFDRQNKEHTCVASRITSNIFYLSTKIKPPLEDHLPVKVDVEDIQSVFHEFGHVLQFLLAVDKDKWSDHLSSVLEIIEIVPKFLEHWISDESILQTLAHLSSEMRIPEDVIVKIQDKRRRAKIEMTQLQALIGQFEFDIFSKAISREEPLVTMQRFLPRDSGLTSDYCLELVMKHNGRDKAIRYRYLMAEVISADIFQRFTDSNASMNEDGMRRLGNELKEILLEPGPFVDGKRVLRELCGREDLSTEVFFNMYKF